MGARQHHGGLVSETTMARLVWNYHNPVYTIYIYELAIPNPSISFLLGQGKVLPEPYKIRVPYARLLGTLKLLVSGF